MNLDCFDEMLKIIAWKWVYLKYTYCINCKYG